MCFGSFIVGFTIGIFISTGVLILNGSKASPPSLDERRDYLYFLYIYYMGESIHDRAISNIDKLSSYEEVRKEIFDFELRMKKAGLWKSNTYLDYAEFQKQKL